MNQRMRRLLGEGPYPFTSDQVNNEGPIEAFVGRGMIVLSQKYSLNMPKGTHCHDSYEFLVPLTDMSHTCLDKRPIIFDKSRLLPINSGQEHGFSKPAGNCHFYAFQVDNYTLNDIALQFCNKGQVVFSNESMDLCPEILPLLNMFKNETKYMQTGIDLILDNISSLVVINLLRSVKSNLPRLVTEKNYCERDNINRAINFLREEYSKNFSLEEVARVANLSPYHFIRIFKSVTGKTPYNYLLDIKIEKSKELLRLKTSTITEICFKCGFNNLEHFSSVFKRKVGILPSQYRKFNIL